MKKKEVMTLVIASIFFVGALVAGYYLLFPSTESESQMGSQKNEAEQVVEVPADIDESTYKIIKNLEDYGEPPLENIGKKDLFAGY